MRCHVPGRALRSAKFWRVSSSPRPMSSGGYSASGWRTPNEKDASLSLRYQTYPRLNETSRDQKKLCGGGNAAIEPLAPSATTSRLFARSGTGPLLAEPPKRYSCQLLATSRHAIRDAGWMAAPLSPASYLYATESTSV